MTTYLRLDLYVNNSEFLVGEQPATERGFRNLVSQADIPFQAADDSIIENGCWTPNAEQRADEDFQSRMFDILGREITERDDIKWIMCLWERGEEDADDEHLEGSYTLAQCE